MIPALLILSPVFPAVSLIVAVRLGRPVLFKQQRPGYRGVPFTMYKFRTMRDAFDPTGQPLPDSERLTAAGRLLRATSLDELPEVVNVLKGDMAIVGPRPLIAQYLAFYTPEQFRRHNVRPGITGWAQVRGRNSLTWEEKFALDTWYVDHWSLRLDLRILVRSLVTVVRREGISAKGHSTMPVFGPSSVALPVASAPQNDG